ncbi:MAG: aspartate/glutamate racemase family protein [Leptolyngbyaceae cyanobacterium T60_A2020_046]|nr:aspartate/glutamate racemase family protein [Leptolyngbyaceae cyanobacterium T60_A2020_046]
MKTIGLIGGMSWESSAEYYRLINEATQRTLGGLHSARCILYSVDFAEIEALQHQNHWVEAAQILCTVAQSLARAGADGVVLCTNTMHKLAPDIEASVSIPLLHIADATAQQVKAQGIQRVGLLGTRFTMEEAFYRDRLSDRHGLDVVIPPVGDREVVHRVIYEELCLGVINLASRQQYREIMARLIAAGAEGIILGCTEIELLVQAADAAVPMFPTTRIHAEAAVAWAIAPDPSSAPSL